MARRFSKGRARSVLKSSPRKSRGQGLPVVKARQRMAAGTGSIASRKRAGALARLNATSSHRSINSQQVFFAANSLQASRAAVNPSPQREPSALLSRAWCEPWRSSPRFPSVPGSAKDCTSVCVCVSESTSFWSRPQILAAQERGPSLTCYPSTVRV